MLLTLLRILELKSGTIELDGVDISRVRLDLLRERGFVTVAQDSLLFSNETLRFNLDPDASLPNDILIDTLIRTKLWSHFSTAGTNVGGSHDAEAISDVNTAPFREHPILDQKVSQFRELSTGERQLFSISRALIKIKKVQYCGARPIVLLDEVTSSLDFATESIIHGIIDEEFTAKGHTTIIVAHNLSILMEHINPETDVVVVMKDGRLQEIITDVNSMRLRMLAENRQRSTL